MKTGRRDSKQSYAANVKDMIPNHNDSISSVLSRFQSMGIDVEATVAILYFRCSLRRKSTLYQPRKPALPDRGSNSRP